MLQGQHSHIQPMAHRESADSQMAVAIRSTRHFSIPDQDIFQLYPVPANDWINIGQFPNQKVSVSIFNSYGQLVLSTVIFEKGKLNISGFSSGCYIVKVDSGERVYSKLLLVKH